MLKIGTIAPAFEALDQEDKTSRTCHGSFKRYKK